MVNVNGTVIGFVSAVAGNVSVANTIPGRMLPTGEPSPGKVSAVDQVPLLGEAVNPIVGFGAVTQPALPLPFVTARLSREAAPPMKGYCTNGWLNAGRKTAVLAMLTHPAGRLFGAKMIAGPLPRNPPKFNCEFGR